MCFFFFLWDFLFLKSENLFCWSFFSLFFWRSILERVLLLTTWPQLFAFVNVKGGRHSENAGWRVLRLRLTKEDEVSCQLSHLPGKILRVINTRLLLKHTRLPFHPSVSPSRITNAVNIKQSRLIVQICKAN